MSRYETDIIKTADILKTSYEIMPRKSLGNKKKEKSAQKHVEKKTSKERQRARYEREFYTLQTERGLLARPIGFQEANSNEMVEVAIVYKLKEGYRDPFERGNVLYYTNPDTEKITRREKVSDKEEMRDILTGVKPVPKVIEDKEEKCFQVLDSSGNMITHTDMSGLVDFIASLKVD